MATKLSQEVIMHYSKALEFLYQLRVRGSKVGLDRVQRFAIAAGSPQKSLRFIHVAGTNGKGSVCAYLEKYYCAEGLKVGLFTSPHLSRFRERIRVGGKPISRKSLIQQVQDLQKLLQGVAADHYPSFFEFLTVMALRHFATMRCDLVVWETGLGGRLDATNIVQPLCSVITHIGMDHQEWLGSSLTSIASEKAGIIKAHTPVVLGTLEPQAEAIMVHQCKVMDSPCYKATEASLPPTVKPGLAGPHQRLNANIAAQVAQVLKHLLPYQSDRLHQAIESTQLAGRFEKRIWCGREVVLDVAHNSDALQALACTLKQTSPWRKGHLHLVFGSLSDKDWQGGLRHLAPVCSHIWLVRAQSDRAVAPGVMATFVESLRIKDLSVRSCCSESLEQTMQALGKQEACPTVITGSFYLVGAARAFMDPEGDSGLEVALNEWGAQLSSRSEKYPIHSLQSSLTPE